jgi:hypothetical protein
MDCFFLVLTKYRRIIVIPGSRCGSAAGGPVIREALVSLPQFADANFNPFFTLQQVYEQVWICVAVVIRI